MNTYYFLNSFFQSNMNFTVNFKGNFDKVLNSHDLPGVTHITLTILMKLIYKY